MPFEEVPGVPPPETASHALLCGRIIAAVADAVMFTNNASVWADAEVIGLDDENGAHSSQFDILLPSGRYRVSVELVDAFDQSPPE